MLPGLLALRFLLELSLLGALAWWGIAAPDAAWAKGVLGAGLPLAAAGVWGAFVAPKALVRVGEPARLAVELVLWAVGGAALAGVGRPWLGLALGLLGTVDGLAVRALGRASRGSPRAPRRRTRRRPRARRRA